MLELSMNYQVQGLPSWPSPTEKAVSLALPPRTPPAGVTQTYLEPAGHWGGAQEGLGL